MAFFVCSPTITASRCCAQRRALTTAAIQSSFWRQHHHHHDPATNHVTLSRRRAVAPCVISRRNRQRRFFASQATNSQHQEEDPCLQWARANPVTAQACLHPPATEPACWDTSFVDAVENKKGASWEAYWKWRRWDLSSIPDPPNGDDQTQSSRSRSWQELGRALTTRALTTPLTAFATVGVGSMGAQPKQKQSPSSNMNPTIVDLDSASLLGKNAVVAPAKSAAPVDQNHHHLRWCCLGARSEASLPVEFWNELLILLDHHRRQRQSRLTHPPASPSVSSLDLQMDFCGPEMDARRPSVRLCSNKNSNNNNDDNSKTCLTLNWVFQGKYHDYHKQQQKKSGGGGGASGTTTRHCDYDAFLLFNPGVGHPHLRDDWRPTLELLFGRRHDGRPRTIVLTAHSEYDAVRDAAFLHEACGGGVSAVDYVENPFAANIEYPDPFLEGHLVRPNHFVAVVRC